MAVVKQCDQCKKVDPEGKDWLQVGVRREPDAENPMEAAAAWSGQPLYDVLLLCCWQCVRDYSLLQVLDQEVSDAPQG